MNTSPRPAPLPIAIEVKRVLPLEDAGAMKEATPVRGGKLTPDAAKAAARSDAQVRELLKVPVTVIELGGSHDISAAVKRVADGKCEYLRVTTRRTKQLLD